MARKKVGTCLGLLTLALICLSGCAESINAAPSDSSHQTVPSKATPEDASFFMTVPFEPTGSQTLEIKQTETAFLSIAMVKQDIPVQNWQKLGWTMGDTIGESSSVPRDCALHARDTVNRQLYAACTGLLNVSIPHDGGDFVYIVFTDTDNHIGRVLQTGTLYNPDTTGLIP